MFVSFIEDHTSSKFSCGDSYFPKKDAFYAILPTLERNEGYIWSGEYDYRHGNQFWREYIRVLYEAH